MYYVVYHKETTHFLRIFRHGCWTDANRFETEGAAKACLTRESKKPALGTREKVNKDDYAILPRDEFDKIEKEEIRHGIVGSEGKEFKVKVNTPWTSGPWSETYWSS
jgi:hypothetical protein